MKEASKPGLHGVFYNSRWGGWNQVEGGAVRVTKGLGSHARVLPSAEIVKQDSE